MVFIEAVLLVGCYLAFSTDQSESSILNQCEVKSIADVVLRHFVDPSDLTFQTVSFCVPCQFFFCSPSRSMEPWWKSACVGRDWPSRRVCVKQRVKRLGLQRSGVLLLSEAVTGRVKGDMSEWGPRAASFMLEGQSAERYQGRGFVSGSQATRRRGIPTHSCLRSRRTEKGRIVLWFRLEIYIEIQRNKVNSLDKD